MLLQYIALPFKQSVYAKFVLHSLSENIFNKAGYCKHETTHVEWHIKQVSVNMRQHAPFSGLHRANGRILRTTFERKKKHVCFSLVAQL